VNERDKERADLNRAAGCIIAETNLIVREVGAKATISCLLTAAGHVARESAMPVDDFVAMVEHLLNLMVDMEDGYEYVIDVQEVEE
jgi:hypothetical protein